MARLIDADALIYPLKMQAESFRRIGEWVRADVLDDCIVEIGEQPIVDAEPVRHGRWINYPECLGYEGAYHDEHIVCSACHSVWNIIDNDAERFDYCPNCGAKMDGEDEG